MCLHRRSELEVLWGELTRCSLQSSAPSPGPRSGQFLRFRYTGRTISAQPMVCIFAHAPWLAL